MSQIDNILSSRSRSKEVEARNMKSMQSPSVNIFMTNFYRAEVVSLSGDSEAL